MGVKPALAFSVMLSGALVCACSGRGTVAVPPGFDRSTSSLNSSLDAPPSARELAAEAASRARVDAKLRAGYLYQVSGTAQSINVAIGNLPKFRMGRGDSLSVKLVPNGEPKYLVRGHGATSRSGQSLPVTCGEGCGIGPGGTPAPGPTPPPNYGPCSDSGGATWVNDGTGEGGCTSRGNTKPLSCGQWTWSSRGKGTLVVPGTGTFTDLDYVVDDGNGGCRLGYI